MGRPINNSNFGAAPGKISIRFHNGTAEATGHIVKQVGASKYLVTADGVNMFTVDLVNSTDQATALVAGQATIKITDAANVVRYVTKLMSASCYTTDGSTLSWTLGAANVNQAALDVVAAPPPAATGITRSPATMALTVGDTSQITASVVPAGADQTVTYTSDDVAVASVSSSGLVTALVAGTVAITISTSNAITALVSVTVADPVVPEEPVDEPA